MLWGWWIMRLTLLTATRIFPIYVQRSICGQLGTLLILLQAHTIATHSKTHDVVLLICREAAMHKLCILKHVHLHDYTEQHKCLLTGDTKNKPAWSHIPKLAQRTTVFFQTKQMGTINTLAPISQQHWCTDTHAPSTVTQADPTYANTKTCCVHSKETTASY